MHCGGRWCTVGSRWCTVESRWCTVGVGGVLLEVGYEAVSASRIGVHKDACSLCACFNLSRETVLWRPLMSTTKCLSSCLSTL